LRPSRKAPPSGRPALGHLSERQDLGSSEVDDPAHGLAVDQVRDACGGIELCEGLESEIERQRGNRQALCGSQQPTDQLVELRRSQNRVRDAARGHLLLAGELSAVVGERDLVDPDDRDVQQVARLARGVQKGRRLPGSERPWRWTSDAACTIS
jgi:hypothetical protein